MTKNYSKISLSFVFIVMILQACLLKDYQIIILESNGEETTTQLVGFLLGVIFRIKLYYLSLFIFYYFFVLLYFMESYNALLSNQRIYYVIRNTSRIRILIKILMSNFCLIVFISIIQLGINYLFSSYHSLNIGIIQYFIMYVFTFYNLLLLYGVIAYWKGKESAMIFSMSWLIISIIGSSTIIDLFPTIANITYVFFPNFLMAARFSSEIPASFGYQYEWAIGVNIVYAISFIVILIQLIKKREII